MKKVIQTFIIVCVMTGNCMSPAYAQKPYNPNALTQTELCTIDVSPLQLDYGDITRAILENDSTISKQATVNVRCSEERSGSIELKLKPHKQIFTSATDPTVIVKLDKLTLDGNSMSTKVISDAEFPNGLNMKEDTDIWAHNHQLKAKDKFLNLSAQITVTLDLSSMVDIRETEQLEEKIIFTFIENYF